MQIKKTKFILRKAWFWRFLDVFYLNANFFETSWNLPLIVQTFLKTNIASDTVHRGIRIHITHLKRFQNTFYFSIRGSLKQNFKLLIHILGIQNIALNITFHMSHNLFLNFHFSLNYKFPPIKCTAETSKRVNQMFNLNIFFTPLFYTCYLYHIVHIFP